MGVGKNWSYVYGIIVFTILMKSIEGKKVFNNKYITTNYMTNINYKICFKSNFNVLIINEL